VNIIEIAGADQPGTDTFLIQESVMDVLMSGAVQARFVDCALSYYALASCAGVTGAGPSPSHDGLPFQASLARLANKSCLSPVKVSKCLRELVRLRVIDDFSLPEHEFANVTFRLRTLRVTWEGGQCHVV
jgi:hypothetical protein